MSIPSVERYRYWVGTGDTAKGSQSDRGASEEFSDDRHVCSSLIFETSILPSKISKEDAAGTFKE